MKKEMFGVGVPSMLIKNWQRFYEEIFGIRVDFSKVSIPEAPNEFSWFACIPEGMTTEQAFIDGKMQFPVLKDKGSLDDVLDFSFGRDAWQHPYIIRLRPNIEPDEDLKIEREKEEKFFSADDTLKERLLLARFLSWEKGLFLDEEKIILCAGSHVLDEGVPYVCWYDKEFWVGLDYSRYPLDYLHSRFPRDGSRSRRIVP